MARTDVEFITEIENLTRGTHWMQETLHDHCWVGLRPNQEPPEGAEVKEKYDTFEVIDYEEGKRKTHPKKKRCYYKARYCLVGMVLKVADLKMEEPINDMPDDDQVLRIFDYIHDSLQKKDQAEPVKVWDNDTARYVDRPLNAGDRVNAIETWNDSETRQRHHVLKLLARAKDRAAQHENPVEAV